MPRPALRPCHLALLLVLAAAAACAPRPAPTPPPTPLLTPVSASDLTAPLLFNLNREYALTSPGVVIVPQVVPASLLANSLTTGEAHLALMIDPPPGLFTSPVAYVSLHVVAHPDNPLGQLSADWVRALFSGQADDWAQVGGAPGAVQVVAREPGSDGGQAFQRLALAGASFSRGAMAAPSWEAMRALVAEQPGAVGFLPAHELDSSVKVLSTPIDLRLLIVAAAPQEPAGPARDFLAWSQSAAGQQTAARQFQPLEP